MEKNIKIAIVDDDPNISELIEIYLKRENYDVFKFSSGSEFISQISEIDPDLIILDVMLPGLDGFQILSSIRKDKGIPVIMVTAKNSPVDKIRGLDLGADDYVVKPFDAKELAARVRAVLRRFNKVVIEHNEEVTLNISVDLNEYIINYKDEKIEAPPKEIELLSYLMENPNRVFTREQLLENVWGYDFIGDSRTVDVHIKRLRNRFEDEESWSIKTVWGIGYKFQINR